MSGAMMGKQATPRDHEAGLSAFVQPRKRTRVKTFMESESGRRKVLAALPHFADWDARVIVPIERQQQSPTDIVQALKARDAPDEAYIVSTDRTIDGCFLPLHDAVGYVLGRGEGTVISCIPGRLGYFEGEAPWDRCILERRQDV